MGPELSPGCTNQSRIGMNLENLRRRDPKSREFLRPLFGQVAVATVRNVLSNSVASLQKVDKLLASKVAELRASREQLQATENDSQTFGPSLDEPDADCSLKLEVHEKVDARLRAPQRRIQTSDEHEKADANNVLYNEEVKHLKDE